MILTFLFFSFFAFPHNLFSIIFCSTYRDREYNYSLPRSSIVRIQQRLIASPPPH